MAKRRWSKDEKKQLQDTINSMKLKGYSTGEIAGELDLTESEVVRLDRESNDVLMTRMRY